MEDANQVSIRLRRLLRQSQSVYQETGSQDLYISYLFIRGKFSNGNPVRAPLLLLPAEISIINGHWTLRMPEESRPVLNKSFLFAYAHHQQSGTPDAFTDEIFDEAETIQDLKTSLIELFKKAEMELNFRQTFIRKILYHSSPINESILIKNTSLEC